MSSQPTPYAQDLAALVEAGVAFDTLRRYADLLAQQGLWHPTQPVNEEGHTLAAAWMTKLIGSPSYGTHQPDDATLGWLLDPVPAETLWSSARPYRPKDTLGHALLTVLASTQPPSRHSVLWSPALWSRLPSALLRSMRPSYRESPPKPSQALECVLTNDRVALARQLLERGWRWSHPSDDPPELAIKSTQAWELFLETGGNPHATVPPPRHDRDAPVARVPLWKALLETAEDQDLRTALTQWASAHAKQDLDSHALETYWAHLERANGPLDHVLKAVRARPDWPSLQNKSGDSVAFVAFHKNRGSLEQLAKTTKALPALTAVNRRGWGLIHHVLSHAKDLSASVWSAALAVANPEPVPGRGLLATLYAHPETSRSGLSYQEYLPDKRALETVLLPNKSKALTAELWWKGTPAEQDAVARHFMGPHHYLGSKSANGWFSLARPVESFVALAAYFPLPDDATPLLRGAVVFNTLLCEQTHPSAGAAERIQALVAQGAKVELHPEMEEQLKKLPLSAPLLSQLRAMQMDTRLPHKATVSRPRPRM